MNDEATTKTPAAVSRRDLLLAAGALASAAAAGPALADGHGSAGHDHAAHAPRHPALLEAVEACTATGRRCISHCLTSFEEGDSSLAVCARRVHEMVAICDAMETLLASNSAYAKGMASVCRQACEDCSAECRKHADKHQECKACMDACDALIPQLEQLTA